MTLNKNIFVYCHVIYKLIIIMNAIVSNLFAVLKNNNFIIIKGAFVAEDDNAELFKKFCTCNEGYLVNRDRGRKYFLSHDNFINKNKFGKKRDVAIMHKRLNDRYNKTDAGICIYEGVFKDKIIIYDCHYIKAVVFYPFFIKKDNILKRYLYLKFEQSSAQSTILHTYHYILSKIFHKSQICRRERDSYNNWYTIDKRFKYNNNSSFEWYTNNVRLGAEFFISANLITIINRNN